MDIKIKRLRLTILHTSAHSSDMKIFLLKTTLWIILGGLTSWQGYNIFTKYMSTPIGTLIHELSIQGWYIYIAGKDTIYSQSI